MEAPPKEVRDRETVKVSLIEIGISQKWNLNQI
jgi:hypothetical protein